ncbi:MAG: c-type cytochrome biogenesis protein CcmI [Aquabacterium sp.]|nr:c-type cytochrome biogenesis protein CcmI [Aquabacterium sp.]
MTPSIEQLKQQLSQLAELAQSGALPDDQYQTAKAKLERQLVDTVLTGKVSEPTAQVSRKLIWGMVAFVVVMGAGGYAWVGNPAAWHVGPNGASNVPEASEAGGDATASSDNGQHKMTPEQISAMVDGLAAKLKTDPNNAEGWAMLARTYAALGRHGESLPAYKKALGLRPDDAQIHADYADAMAVANGRKLDGEPTALINKALKLDPNNFKALFLSGTIAFDKQDFKAAADLWARANQHAPADNPELGKHVRSALDVARQRAGLPALAPEVASTANANATSSDEVQVAGVVTLSKALATQVSPDDTVFIFAKAAQGPKIPLAVLRKQVKDLPVKFSLTDAMAMSPQMKLSGFAEVTVGARISKSGQATPQTGDFQGTSAPVKLGAKDIQIEITEPVR